MKLQKHKYLQFTAIIYFCTGVFGQKEAQNEFFKF